MDNLATELNGSGAEHRWLDAVTFEVFPKTP